MSLLDDLRVDSRREAPAPVGRPTTPALELRLTPLHWAWPRLERAAGGWALRSGPVTLVLQP